MLNKIKKYSPTKYISYLLQMLHLEKYGSGSAIPTLNRNDLDNLEVTFHSLIEQQHIVDIRRCCYNAI